jgi:magnesium chelatase subunit I
MSDLVGIIPYHGQIELVYEGEQEGPYQVAFNLLREGIPHPVHELFPQPGIV